MTEYKTVVLGGIEVCYTDDLDGGGARYGQDYVDFVTQNVGARHRTFEWCAGPAFIGFSLLGHQLTDTLCLADVNPGAVAACEETIRRNGLEDRVRVYTSDCLEQIPATECWDLVVGNPPHSGTTDAHPEFNRPEIIYQDAGWELHRRFYATVREHLDAGAQVVIQENARFSSLDTFRDMVERAGLSLVGAPGCEAEQSPYYFYVWSALAGPEGK
jgi:methylase of polypeptide subunit release factors